jgi:hypothetical protein
MSVFPLGGNETIFRKGDNINYITRSRGDLSGWKKITNIKNEYSWKGEYFRGLKNTEDP